MKRAMSLWCAALVLAACSASDPPRNDDDALPKAADDSCARFDFGFTAGGCPEALCQQALCSCPAPISCISGMNDRCMSAVDCDVACAADPETLFICSVSIDPCHVDADCQEGRCVTEPGAGSGECESGERAARCREDRDCATGNCIAGDTQSRACSPGEASDLCNRDSDCISGHCSLAAAALTGECD